MAHYPTRRRWLLGWLPARCGCGLPRFDRCPDAVADAQAGHLAPRGGYDTTDRTAARIADGLRRPPARNDRGWWPA